MPLLQSIVGELDRELARLGALRAIVAGLSRTPKLLVPLISSPALAEKFIESAVATAVPASEAPRPSRKARAVAGKPRERRTRKLTSSPEVRAFAAAVPSGPVVFNPSHLAKEKAKRQQSREAAALPEPVAQPGDLEAQSRDLAARWSTGPVQ